MLALLLMAATAGATHRHEPGQAGRHAHHHASHHAGEHQGRAVLGISIGGGDEGAVPGVAVVAVSPAGPAAAAGIEAGDVVTVIDGVALAADSAEAAASRLVERMSAVKPGDSVQLELLREGAPIKTEVAAGSMDRRMLRGAGRHGPGRGPGMRWRHAGVFAGLELVPLTEGLGRYFGTAKGLLVVRAPRDAALGLEDGDVISSIGGREPHSVGHAMRILRSYAPGESLQLSVYRERRQRKLELSIPAASN